MRPRRLLACLATVAMLLQALAPIGPALAERVERAVICGADGPVTVLIDLASGRPVAPAPPPADRHDCCPACFHCGCTGVGEAPEGAAPAAATPMPRPARALPSPARRAPSSARARAPPVAPNL